LALRLKGGGHEVQGASGGVEGLRAAQARHPDPVLLDLWLPHLDGYQVAQRLREQAEFRKALLVAITGCEPGRGGRRPEELGIDRVLSKPVAPEALQEAL